MAKRTFKAGATSQTVDVFVQDSSSTVGAGLAALAYNTANLKAYYRKGATGSATAITLATQTVGGAWSSGGFVEIDATNMKGVYRLDVPDTVFASAGWATIYLYGATNMAPVVLEVEIVAYDPYNATTLGLTNLDVALSTIAAYIDTEVAAIKAKTDNLPATPASTSDIPSSATIADAVWDEATSGHLTAGTFGLGIQGMVLNCGTALSGSSTTIRLASTAPAVNDIYIGHWVVIISGTGLGQARLITSYTSTKFATVSGWTTTPDSTSVYVIVPAAYIQGVNGDTPQTGDAFARLGAPTGASVSADIATVAAYVDTEVAAIKAKTDNLPSDPADASDIAASFSTVNSTLSTISAYIDTEVAAIKAKTDNLPAAPAAVGDIPTAAANADAVWDELLSGHLTSSSFGAVLNAMCLHSGAILTATSSTARLAASGPSATSDTYNGCWLVITSGTGIGQARLIYDYVGSSKQCLISPDWITTPLSGDTYVVVPAAYINAIYGAVGSVTGDVGGNLTGTVGSLSTAAKAEVNAEVLDVLNVDTYAEPGQGAPAATTSIFAKINYLYKAWRNKSTQNATDYKLYADDASTVDQKATTSNDGTTFTRTEITTGP